MYWGAPNKILPGAVQIDLWDGKQEHYITFYWVPLYSRAQYHRAVGFS